MSSVVVHEYGVCEFVRCACHFAQNEHLDAFAATILSRQDSCHLEVGDERDIRLSIECDDVLEIKVLELISVPNPMPNMPLILLTACSISSRIDIYFCTRQHCDDNHDDGFCSSGCAVSKASYASSRFMIPFE